MASSAALLERAEEGGTVPDPPVLEALSSRSARRKLSLERRLLDADPHNISEYKAILEECQQQQAFRTKNMMERLHTWDTTRRNAHIKVALGLSPELALDLKKALPKHLHHFVDWRTVLLCAALIAAVVVVVGLCKHWDWSEVLFAIMLFFASFAIPCVIYRFVKDPNADNRTLYFNTVKLRVLYTSMMVLAVTFSTFSGVTIETFLGCFRQQFQGEFARVHLWALPLFMVILGIFCEGCITIGFDAAQKTPMVEFQVTILMGLYAMVRPPGRKCSPRRWLWGAWLLLFPGFPWVMKVFPLLEKTNVWSAHTIGFVCMTPVMWWLHSMTESPLPKTKAPCPLLEHCQITDWFCFLCLEVIPLSAGCGWGVLYHSNAPDGRSLLGALLRTYLWTGITFLCICATMFQFSSMFIRFRGQDNDLLGKKLELRKVWMSILHNHTVPPGMLSQVYDHIFPTEEDKEEGHVLMAYSLLGVEHKRAEKLCSQVAMLPFAVCWCWVWIISLALDMLSGYLTSKTVLLYLMLLMGILTRVLVWVLYSYESRITGNNWCMWEAWRPLVLSWIFWSLTVFSVEVVDFGRSHQAILTFFSFGVVLYFTSQACLLYFPELVGRSYYFIVTIYLLIVIALAASQAEAINIPATAATVVVGAGSPLGGRWQGPVGTGPLSGRESVDYGVCQETFGGEILGVVDLAQLAGVVYEEKCAMIRDQLPALFGDRAPQMHNCSGYNEFPRMAVFDFGADSRNGTRVIALKGTSTVLDGLVDATLYSTVKILQFVAYLLPVIDILPVDQVQWLLWRFHIHGQLEAEDRLWGRMIEAVDLYARGTQRRTLLTGHSLGGAMASVIVARLGLSAVVFSAPGTEYSAVRFGIYQPHYWMSWDGSRAPCKHCGVQVSKARVLNVIPMFDEVPLVDKQLDEVQKIECRAKTSRGRSFWGDATICHSLMRTACELWRICGDPVHHRRFNCSEFVGNQTLGMLLKPDDPF